MLIIYQQMSTNLVPKSSYKYMCVNCHYNTSRKSQYDRHLSTQKHINNEISTNINKKSSESSIVFICKCGKIYKERTGLWRHKSKCFFEEVYNNTEYKNNEITNETIMNILKQNSELQNMLLEQNKTIITLSKNSGNYNNNTNSNNKTFNLNVFLNETCKDAMNITDFVDSINLQLTDLERVGELGYVEGISNIIVKNLNALDITQRPVHCTDSKREILYIKDQDKWEKEDDENKKIRKVIKKIANKNTKLLPEFKAQHPDCVKSTSKYSDQYSKLIIESMGGSGDNDLEKEDKIIKKISKEVFIDKEKFSNY